MGPCMKTPCILSFQGPQHLEPVPSLLLPIIPNHTNLSAFLKQLLTDYVHVCFSVLLSGEGNAGEQGPGQHLAQAGIVHAEEQRQTAGSRWSWEEAQKSTCTGGMEVTQETQNCGFKEKKEKAGKGKR